MQINATSTYKTMKIIEPSVELWSEENTSTESHIARCARVCYGKEYKEPNQEADKKMVEGLIKRGHLSMLRHSTIYGMTPFVKHMPSCFNSEFVSVVTDDKLDNVYFAYNKQFDYEHDDANCEVCYTPTMFLDLCKGNPYLFSIYRLTFCITTQDAIAKELNRKSPNAIAEKSTRYCNFKDGIEICKPWWWNAKIGNLSVIDMMQLPTKEKKAAFSWREDENAYTGLLDEGMKPEDARDVLPKALATKVIYTYSVKEWEDILALRLYDKTGPAHPNAHVIMQMVKDQISNFAKEHNIDYQV